MSILLPICLAVAVISITVYLMSKAKLKPEPEETKKTDGYPAVLVDFGKSEACPAVMKIVGQRFLRGAAPDLPLVDCTAEVCSCTFRHYADRQTGPRRAYEKGVVQRRYEGIEKRTGQLGRRAADIFANTVEREKEQFSGTLQNTYQDFIKTLTRMTGFMTAPTEKQTAEGTAGLFGSALRLLRRMRRKAT